MRTLGELYTYQNLGGGKMGPMEGCSDDLVMALAIGLEVIRTTAWAPVDLPIC